MRISEDKCFDAEGYQTFETAIISHWFINDEKSTSQFYRMAKDVWVSIDPSAEHSRNALAVLTGLMEAWFNKEFAEWGKDLPEPLDDLLISAQRSIFWPEIAHGVLFYLNDIGEIEGYDACYEVKAKASRYGYSGAVRGTDTQYILRKSSKTDL